MSLNINTVEVFNVLVVAVLFYILIRKRDVATLLFVLFVYGTLHFGFAAVTLASDDSARLLKEMHIEGGGVLAKIAALSLLGAIFVFLSRHAYSAYLLLEGNAKSYILHVFLLMASIMFGYFLNIRPGDWLQLKNVVSLEAMIAFALVGFLASSSQHTFHIENARILGWIGLLLFCVADCIAIYEVFSHSSWAGTMSSTGTMVFRASSILFNPNLFGFWASLVYLWCAGSLRMDRTNKTMALWGMVLASVAIYFSGSRSSGYLLLIVLCISLFMLKRPWTLLPLILMPMAMLVIYMGVVWGSPNTTGWNEVALLGERFLAAPSQLMNYGLMKMGHVLSDIYQLFGGRPISMEFFAPAEIVESIEGRVVGEGRDAGWLVLYQDTGWVGLVAVIFASLMLLRSFMQAWMEKPDVNIIHGLAALLFCLLSGFVMRFQIFPVWLFISLVLIASEGILRRPAAVGTHFRN